MTTPTPIKLHPLREEADSYALERRATMRCLQEALLIGREDLAVFGDCQIAELLDDDGLLVPLTRVQQHMQHWSTERPDLVTTVRGRYAWLVRLAGFDLPDHAS